MIFVFAEDATLYVVEGLDEVRRLCEPIDVESGVFSFYDGDGRPLGATFTRPNRERRIFGVLSSVEPGEYVLGPAADASGDPISVALAETEALEPNRWFSDLEQVQEFLVGKGALLRGQR